MATEHSIDKNACSTLEKRLGTVLKRHSIVEESRPTCRVALSFHSGARKPSFTMALAWPYSRVYDRVLDALDGLDVKYSHWRVVEDRWLSFTEGKRHRSFLVDLDRLSVEKLYLEELAVHIDLRGDRQL